MANNALVRVRQSKRWSVDRMVELNLSAEQIRILKTNALDRANGDVAQICENGLAVVHGKRLREAFCFRAYAP